MTSIEVHRIVELPDGMTVSEAERILADARPWVPVAFWHQVPKGARYRSVGGVRGDKDGKGCDGTYEVHPDDAPDPDADLLKAIAEDAYVAYERTEHLGDAWANVARVALNLVREADAR